MSKICKKTGCKNNVFGKEYCKNHQYLRPDYKQKSLKRTPLKKVSKNQQLNLGEKHKLTLKDREFFNSIWKERDHIDFETGEPIYGEPLTVYFHHILPKRPKHLGGFPEYRYEKWNIIIITWDTHTKAENNLDLVPKIKDYTEFLKLKYT